MAINTQTIRIDLNTGRTIPVAFAHQNDTNRQLTFQLYNNGVAFTPSSTTVKFAYKSPIVNGRYSVITGSQMASGTVSGNTVTVTLPAQYTQVSGVGLLTMILTTSGNTLRPVNIKFVCQGSADGDDTILNASDWPDGLYDYMDNWLAENEPTEIANLKSDINTLDTKISVAVKEVDEETSTDTEMLSRSDFTAGIMSPNGTVTSSSAIGYLNTPIAVEPGETIRATKYYYNSGGEIAGQAAGSFRACAFFADNTFTYTNNGFSTVRDSFVVPEGVYYIQPSISALMTGTYAYAKIHRVTYSVSYALSDELAETIASPKLQALNNGTLTTKDLANSYACAMPKTDLRMTVGMPEKWYKKSMTTPPTDFVFATYGYSTTEHYNKYTEFPNEEAISSVNGYYWRHYDPLLNLIDSYDGSAGFGGRRRVIAENLSDCSVLVIGDSTVDHDTMTGKMLSYFTEKGHTLTLLGTLVSSGNPSNRNEGRAGWTTADYLADTTKNNYTNPFWNPNNSSFDFSYYMTQQGYTGVDFVVIQLGINDLYPSTSVGGGSTKEAVWANIKTMIDSILSYNASTKIILNLPTTPNADESQHRISEFMYRNAVVQYNAYAIAHALSEYTDAKVRCSYCHLILDPETEIRDNVHPTVTGYEKMALEVISQINVWQNGY